MCGHFDKNMQIFPNQSNGEDANKMMLLTKRATHFDYWSWRNQLKHVFFFKVGSNDHIFEVMEKLRLKSNFLNCRSMSSAEIQQAMMIKSVFFLTIRKI